jgi:hypothetical protein
MYYNMGKKMVVDTSYNEIIYLNFDSVCIAYNSYVIHIEFYIAYILEWTAD